MSNRTVAVIITIAVVLLCACPGLAFLCFGITDFIDHYALNSYIYGITNRGVSDFWGIVGICSGIIFIVIAVLVSFFVLRKKKETPPPSSDEPLPPAI